MSSDTEDERRLPRTPLDTPEAARALRRLMESAADRTGSPPTRPTAQKRAPTNRKQKILLVVAALLVIAMFVFPPFHAELPGGGVQGLGYSWLLHPPIPAYPYKHLVGTVDIGLLVTQWLGVLIISALAFLVLKD